MISNILKIERECLGTVAEVLSQNCAAKKILYVTDSVVDELYGNSVRKQIESIGEIEKEFVVCNSISYSMKLAERIIASDIDCIVGMGGGKVLDVCKYASYISKKPMLSIPTTAANDGLVSPIAVLKQEDGRPKSLGCMIPAMILIDIDVIRKCPLELIKAGIGDTISNYMALIDWKLASERGKEQMNGYAYLMSQNALDVLMKTKFDSICPEFIDVLIKSLVLSGIAMDFTGNSRPVSGSEHLFSHALDYYSEKKNLHGIQVALGTVAVLKLIGHDYSEVLNYLRKFKVDINPQKLGIDKDTFIFCMQHATSMRKNRYTYLHEIRLEEGKLSVLYDQLVEELMEDKQ